MSERREYLKERLTMAEETEYLNERFFCTILSVIKTLGLKQDLPSDILELERRVDVLQRMEQLDRYREKRFRRFKRKKTKIVKHLFYRVCKKYDSYLEERLFIDEEFKEGTTGVYEEEDRRSQVEENEEAIKKLSQFKEILLKLTK